MRSRFIISSPLAALLILASSAPGYDQISIPTTADAFYQPGTQPLPDRPGTDPVQPMDEFRNASFSCQQCHLFDDDDNPEIDTGPMNLWAASMMGQSTRDPVWQAALAISNRDAELSGEYCIRCHAPTAWGSGRSSSGTIEEFIYPDDYDGINCNMCHRMVDPVADEENPSEDDLILQDLNHHYLMAYNLGCMQQM